jgi:UDP-N-acetylglucosamine pyrophosphorylase
MGLEKAKSLLTVRGDDTFLDFIAKQVKNMRETNEGAESLKFMFMNSFSTSDDTKAYLQEKYLDKKPEEGGLAEESGDQIEFVQNISPKVAQDSLEPAECATDKDNEWCPPGHGDLYPALRGTGKLDELIAAGIKYMFVSNSDNLGATMDLKLLSFFAESKAPFMMEVCERTDSDKKGGHLCRPKGQATKLMLRESAQCEKSDEAEFQNITKHKFFNTNNLWVDLEELKKTMDAQKGVMPLALIKNSKTVDPRDGASQKVYQLETAMGAAIECFDNTQAVVVPRTRFAPVKTCNDLLALRSDAYKTTDDHRLVLQDEREGVPPNVSLDNKYYKMVDGLQELTPNGVPSLIKCKSLKVEGKVTFAAGVIFEGDVVVKNAAAESKEVAAGAYKDQTVTL